jgi:hypothetical protein
MAKFIDEWGPRYDDGMPSHGEVEAAQRQVKGLHVLQRELVDAFRSLEDPEADYVEIEGFGLISRGDIPQLARTYFGGEQEMYNSNDSDFLRREAERMLKRAEALDSVPQTDEFEDKQVITFTKLLGGKTYHYAAIKTEAGWCTTGSKSSNNLPWNELIAFITANNLMTITVLDMQAGKNIKDYVEGVTKVLEGETK